MVEARVLRRWLVLWNIWISASCLDQTHIQRKSLARWNRSGGKEHKLFHLSCLHCGYSGNTVLKSDVWPVFHCNGRRRVRGTAGRREDKVVFHFCSGGVCPPQTITMLLHYHGNSSIGARDSKESGFVPFGSLAAFLLSLFLISWWQGERTEDFFFFWEEGVEL